MIKTRGIDYRLRKSKRARYMRLSVYPGGSLVVTVPFRVPTHAVEQFIERRREWILRAIKKLSKYPKVTHIKRSSQDYAKYKEAALAIALLRVTHFSAVYKLRVGHVRIRNQKTRWGSCSKVGNLNFNYKIALLPPSLQDYLVVHELCHIQEFNHSKRFWSLVEKTLPNYKELRKELRLQ